MAVSAATFFALKSSSCYSPIRFNTFGVFIRIDSPVFNFIRVPNMSKNCKLQSPFLTRVGSRPPPQSQSSSGKNPNFFSGLQTMVSKAEDSLRIFFAVLFWMSLFFWQGRDGDRRKGLRKRK